MEGRRPTRAPRQLSLDFATHSPTTSGHRHLSLDRTPNSSHTVSSSSRLQGMPHACWGSQCRSGRSQRRSSRFTVHFRRSGASARVEPLRHEAQVPQRAGTGGTVRYTMPCTRDGDAGWGTMRLQPTTGERRRPANVIRLAIGNGLIAPGGVDPPAVVAHTPADVRGAAVGHTAWARTRPVRHQHGVHFSQ